MNSEHPNPYTAEEMESALFQLAPVEVHVDPEDRLAWDTKTSASEYGATVGYIRRDIYEALAAELQRLQGCCTDLAKLDESRFGVAS